ncbi:MAG: response regulator [Actinobacteria bacterium]|nr:MAG: response regulator [Actinomycetota bacterium]
MLVKATLKVREYEVVEAGDGEETIEVAVSTRPDLILLDVMMPKMDGFDCLKLLRKRPETQDCAIVMLTTAAQESDQIRGWDGGVDDYIIKPFNPSALLETIERLLSASGERSRQVEIQKLQMLKEIKATNTEE